MNSRTAYGGLKRQNTLKSEEPTKGQSQAHVPLGQERRFGRSGRKFARHLNTN